MTQMTRGPLTPAVYWRRRLFVLGVVAALLLITVNLVRGNDGTPDDASAKATTVAGGSSAGASPSSAPTTTPTGKKDGKNGGKRGGKKGGATTPSAPTTPAYTPPPAPVLVDPVGFCADSDVSVSPYVTGAVAGRAVTITLRLRTITAAACTWRISPGHLAFKITQDGEETWTSRECRRKVPTDSVVVRQAVTSTYDLTWSSRLSDAGCPTLAAFAQPGEYDVEVAAIGGEPASDTFTLGEPVAVTAPATTGKGQAKR